MSSAFSGFPSSFADYNVVFPSALTFAHLALAAAESLALTARIDGFQH